jgi:hypothetical protein
LSAKHPHYKIALVLKLVLGVVFCLAAVILVTLLTQQLGGRLESNRSAGAEFRITFAA